MSEPVPPTDSENAGHDDHLPGCVVERTPIEPAVEFLDLESGPFEQEFEFALES